MAVAAISDETFAAPEPVIHVKRMCSSRPWPKSFFVSLML